MDEIIRIENLKPGDRAEVAGYESADPAYRRRLLSMGLTRGVSIDLVKVAPLGDPVELRVRGFNLSLRKGEAEALRLRRIEE